jgi:16S rRNA (cytosine967-C5)-methyltransferase
MKVTHQIRAFEQILASYDGTLPLHRFLVTYFKRNKKMGSSDRRWANRYIYSYFRLGRALQQEEAIQRLAIADFLCNTSVSLVIETYLPALIEQVNLPVQAKLTLVRDLYPQFDINHVFPFHSSLISAAVDREAFLVSFFTQPDLFIRLQRGHRKNMLDIFKAEGIAVHELSETTLSMPNGTRLESIFPEQKYYQVQDLSSQKTGAYFHPQKYEYWWDCCAASGGKSLLLHDLEPTVQLMVSDVRENSLYNLDQRFQTAGISKYQKKVLDLMVNNEQELHHYAFDGIILDAPCSGSGTWGRTPEMLHYFDQHKISFFQNLQKTIAANVVKYLKPGKALVYITCSVFKQENEEVVAYLQQEHQLSLESMEVISGYQDKADTMFVARLIKS